MVGLAIHTCSPALGLALTDFAGGDRHQVWPLGRELTRYLHPCLMEFIQPYQWTDLQFVAVAQGPGGFTGTRMGVVTARTLAQQLEIPLFGVSSLAAIAHTQRLGISEPTAIAVEMPARRNECFGGIYTLLAGGELAEKLPDRAYPQGDWEAILQRWPEPYQRVIVGEALAPSVTGVLSLAVNRWQQGDRPHWSTVLPFYGQHPVD